MNRVLVVAAHPDDEVLGCGATIYEHTQKKDNVSVLILGEGLTSRLGFNKGKHLSTLINLKESTKKACKILGVADLKCFDFPDNKFDSLPLLEIVHKVEPYFSKYAPNIVYTHFSNDVNIDHRITNSVVEILARPLPDSAVKMVLNFETPSSTEWNFSRKAFSPNYFVPISDKSLKKKIQALCAYKNEIRLFPHPRSEKFIRALATYRGGQSGINLSEAFRVQYIIKYQTL